LGRHGTVGFGASPLRTVRSRIGQAGERGRGVQSRRAAGFCLLVVCGLAASLGLGWLGIGAGTPRHAVSRVVSRAAPAHGTLVNRSADLSASASRLGGRRSGPITQVRSGVVLARAGSPGLEARLSAAGAIVSGSHGSARIALLAFSAGAGWLRAGRVLPTARGGVAGFDRRGLVEWWASQPDGVEQGFDVSAPAQRSDGRVRLVFALTGALGATLRRGTVEFAARRGAAVLRYGGLSAIDARGRALPARLVLHGSRLSIVVDARGARFPVRIDPAWTTPVTVTGSGAEAIAVRDNGATSDANQGSIPLVAYFTQTTTSVSSSANPSQTGATVTYTATVAPTPTADPTDGTVSFDDGTGVINGCTGVPVSSGTATCSQTYGTPGSHAITATYSGNRLLDPSTSQTLTQIVENLTPTTTSVSSSANPSQTGATVTYTATVTPAPTGGTVSFSDGGSAIAGCGTVPVSNGTATCVQTYGTPGSHSIVATYSGDASFGASDSASLAQTVSPKTTGPPAITLKDPQTNTYGDSLSVSLEPCAADTVSMVVTVGASITTPTTLTLSATGNTSGFTESLSTTSVGDAGAGSPYGQPITLSLARTSSAGSGPVTITITATNAGGSSTATVIANRAGLTAQGLFVTQGSQYQGAYGLLLPSSPSLSGDDYSGVTLVSGKKTVVRLYADAPGETQGLPGVTALLYGYDKHGHQLHGSPLRPDYGTSSGSLPDAHASANGEFVTDSELESDANAYTFTLPYSWTGGYLTEVGAPYPKGQTIKLIGSVVPPPAPPSSKPQPHPGRGQGASCAPADGNGDNFTLNDVPFTEVGAHYPATIYPVALTDNGAQPAPPSQVFQEAESAYPLPNNDFDVGNVPYLAVVDATTVFKTASGLGWIASNQALLSLLQNEIPGRSGAHIVGVATPGFGYTNGIPGQYSVVTGGSHRPLTSVAHELGHQFGLPHASTACGGGGESWSPDQQGYLDGIGLNTTSEPYDFIAEGLNGFPDAYDFMSYCAQIGARTGEPDDPNDWLSPRNWQQLITNFGTGPGSSAADATSTTDDVTMADAAVDPQRLVVTGFVDSQGVQIGNVEPQLGAAPPAGSSVDTYTLIARGAAGQVVGSVAMAVTSDGHIDPGAGPAEPLVQITGDVPAAGVRSVEIVDGSTVMASRQRPARPPEVRILAPRAHARVGGTRGVLVRWRAASPEHQPLTVTVDYSADGGRTWRSEFVGPNVGRVSLSSFDFTPSRNARVRLRVSDGFNETVTMSRPFTTLGAAPYVTIQSSFAKRMRFAGDASLQLAGAAIDQRLTELPPRSLKWSDGPFALGTGPTISTGPLPPGVNHIRLVARGPDGLTASRTLTVDIARVRLAFLALSIPQRLSRRAHKLSFKAKASIPTKLTIDGRAFKLTRKLERFSLALGAGRVPLLLRVTVAADRITTPFAVALTRR